MVRRGQATSRAHCKCSESCSLYGRCKRPGDILVESWAAPVTRTGTHNPSRPRRWTPTLLVFAATLLIGIVLVSGSLNAISWIPTARAQGTTTTGLASWNPNVACAADLVTIRDVLGPAYPHQDLNGSRYQVNSTSGGIPLDRSLSPPCTITNMTGQTVSPFVQINGVSLYGYGVKTTDCSGWYSKQNGGGRYPGNQTFCTNAGQVITIGTTSGYMKIEIDRDWLGKGYCGPNVPSCDNATLAQEQSSGSISLDVQGFVFWEGPYHWELHPFTAWKLSSAPPPPPPSNAPPTVDFTWSPSTGTNQTTFNFTASVSDDHDSPSAIQVRWDWQGDGVWDTTWSTTKTAQHRYSTAGNKTVVLQAMDSGGLTTAKNHIVTVSASPPPPPPPNAPPTADFTWTPTSGDTTTVFTFTAQVSDDHDSASSIQVRWDWTGFGTWDTAWSTTKTATHSFSTAGNYGVVVQAIDSGGLTASATHTVTVTAPPPPPPNSPPTVDFSWTPTSGDTSTVFTFTAQATDDHDSASAIQVRWDWTGDGTWDTAWSTTKTATHTFASAGNYAVVVQAMDSGGLTASQSHSVSVSAPPPPPPNAPPSVDFSSTPTSGDTSTVFTFTAQVSDDHDSPSSIQVRWDWNGDGTWDTGWSTTKTATHTFATAGVYSVVAQAMDSGGLTANANHTVTVTTPPPPPPPGDFSIGVSPGSLT